MRDHILLSLGLLACAACGADDTVSGQVASRSFDVADAVFCVVDNPATETNSEASQIAYFLLSTYDNACAELQALVRHETASQMLFAVQLSDPESAAPTLFKAGGYAVSNANTQAHWLSALKPRPQGLAQAKLWQWSDNSCGLVETMEYTGQSGTFLVSQYQAGASANVDFDVSWDGNQNQQGHFVAQYCDGVDSLWSLDIAQNNTLSCLP